MRAVSRIRAASTSNINNGLLGITTAQTGLRTQARRDHSARDAFHRSIENTLNWQKGSHSVNLGGSFTQFELWMENQQIVPELRFGVVSGDPAEEMFTTANFPGASTTNLDRAQGLYAILTGRVSEVRDVARLNESTGQDRGAGQRPAARPPAGSRLLGAGFLADGTNFTRTRPATNSRSRSSR